MGGQGYLLHSSLPFAARKELPKSKDTLLVLVCQELSVGRLWYRIWFSV